MHLYISDLDGTLLRPDASISPETSRILNHLISRGLHFTVATARTEATVKQILEGVRIQIPVVLMNGSCIFDLQTGSYVKTEQLSENAKTVLLETIRRQKAEGFIYSIDQDRLTTFYERADRPESLAFLEERTSRYQKKFVRVADFFEGLSDRSIVYYSTTGSRQDLEQMKMMLDDCKDTAVSLYLDVYQTDKCFLEVSSVKASKYSAVQYLKQRYAFDSVTCFGDNVNDLPMFKASDTCYAVANALPEVQQQADDVIGSNESDGVARWLEQHVFIHQGTRHESEDF